MLSTSSTLHHTQRCSSLKQPLCYNGYLPSDSSRVGCFTTSPGLFISPYSNAKGSFRYTEHLLQTAAPLLFEIKLEEDLSSSLMNSRDGST